jgi:hypothetical protein
VWHSLTDRFHALTSSLALSPLLFTGEVDRASGSSRLETEGSVFAYHDPSVIRQDRADATSPINRGGKFENTVQHGVLEISLKSVWERE